MAKQKTNKDFIAIQYSDNLVSACNSFEIDPTDENVKIIDSFETLEEAKEAAEAHAATDEKLTYKF